MDYVKYHQRRGGIFWCGLSLVLPQKMSLPHASDPNDERVQDIR